MSLSLRYMRMSDIPEVVAIDQIAFNPSWSAQSYAYEVTQSNYSHMVVLERSRPMRRPTLVERLFGRQPQQSGCVAGYGGLWHIVDEAHISTIAVHPDMRGSGYGEVLLAGMIRRSLTLRASYIVLEVRVSNVTAQNLYKKYDFVIVDTKRGYYHNNNEDAFDMRLDLQDENLRERFASRYAGLARKMPFADAYTAGARPRPAGVKP